MVKETSWASRLFDIFNIIVLAVIALVTIIPFIYVVAGSFATQRELLEKGFILFPTEFSLEAYKYIFSTSTLMRSLGVTIFITIVGTLINITLTCLMAYPLSRRDMDFRSPIQLLIIFTMLFSGGMIPTFLVVKELGMLDTYWSLLLPGAISAFNLIIIRSFFQQLPPDLEESAKIDGASDPGILLRIVIPLSLPALATFSLFYAVGTGTRISAPSCILTTRPSGRFRCCCGRSSCCPRAAASGIPHHLRVTLFRRTRLLKWRSSSSPPSRF